MANWETRRKKEIAKMVRFNIFWATHQKKFYVLLSLTILGLVYAWYMPYYKCNEVCDKNNFYTYHLKPGTRATQATCYCQTKEDCKDKGTHPKGKRFEINK